MAGEPLPTWSAIILIKVMYLLAYIFIIVLWTVSVEITTIYYTFLIIQIYKTTLVKMLVLLYRKLTYDLCGKFIKIVTL